MAWLLALMIIVTCLSVWSLLMVAADGGRQQRGDSPSPRGSIMMLTLGAYPYCVTHRGKRYTLVDDDDQCARFMHWLHDVVAESRREGATPIRLVSYRSEYRKIIRDQPVMGLIWCLTTHTLQAADLGDEVDLAKESSLQRLAIILAGRCGNSLLIRHIARFRSHQSRKVRVAVARALCRLAARAELQQMAEQDTDVWIRDYARRHARREFAARMRQFLRDDVDASRRIADDWQSPMPLVLKTSIRARHRPKSSSIIRRILEHIRLVLRGA